MKIEQTTAVMGLMRGEIRDEVEDDKRFLAFLRAFDTQQAEISTAQSGVAKLGLLGWVDYEARRQAEEAARNEVMAKWGLESDEDVEALSYADTRKFEAEVAAATEDKLAQALKAGALEEMDKKASRLYRNTPLPEEDDGNIAF